MEKLSPTPVQKNVHSKLQLVCIGETVSYPNFSDQHLLKKGNYLVRKQHGNHFKKLEGPVFRKVVKFNIMVKLTTCLPNAVVKLL